MRSILECSSELIGVEIQLQLNPVIDGDDRIV